MTMTSANTMLEKERFGRENRRLPADVNNVGIVLVDAAGGRDSDTAACCRGTTRKF